MLHQHLLHAPRLHFPHFANRELEEMFYFQFLKNLAFGLVGIFVPMFLYDLGFSVWQILLIFAGYSAGHGVVAFLLGRVMIFSFGIKHTFVAAMAGYILAFAALQTATPAGIAAAIALFALADGVYWGAHHSMMTIETDPGHAGSEVAAMTVIARIAGAVTPAIGGGLIFLIGFEKMFWVACGILLLSTVPLFFSREIDLDGQEKLRGAGHLRAFFAVPTFPKSVAGDGMYYAGMTPWSLYLYLALGGLKELGGLLSAISGAQILAGLGAGRLRDRGVKVFAPGGTASVLARLVGVGVAIPGFAAPAAIGSVTAAGVTEIPFFTARMAALYGTAKGPRAVSLIVAHESFWHLCNAPVTAAIGVAAYFWGIAGAAIAASLLMICGAGLMLRSGLGK